MNSVSNWKPTIENSCFLQHNVKCFANLSIKSNRPSNKSKDQRKIHIKASHLADQYNIFSFLLTEKSILRPFMMHWRELSGRS
jgi:hypothetical protein